MDEASTTQEQEGDRYMITFKCLRCSNPFESFSFVGRVKSTEYKVRGVCNNPQCSESNND